jgi:gliding motility-associated-like protein
MKHVYALIWMLISTISYSQYCPALGPDQILPCGVTSTTLTADLSQCVAGSNPNQTTSYGVATIPYIAQTNTGATVALGDDSQSGTFNIGFTFCFYGQTYTQFRIGSNGWISLGAGAQPVTFATSPIPNAAATIPKNCIMSPWQDWNPGIGGQIRYQTSGTAPCRKLTVSWIGVPMYSCTNLQGTFHIVIYESTNYIESYIANKPACNQWVGGTAVHGIHNATGTQAVTVPGRNSTQWTTVNNAWRWTPNGAVVTPTLVWYQVGNPVPIAQNVNQITVTPPAGGAYYTCHLEYPVCNAGWSTCNAGAGQGPDTVQVVPGPPVLNQPNVVVTNPVCNASCDGTIVVTPTNGTAPYTYIWTTGQTINSLTGLCAGTYTVTVADVYGCNITTSATLIDPAPLIAPLMSATNPVCAGDCNGTATVNPIDGVAPYTYAWSNSQITQTATSLCQGTYTVTVTDANGCTASNNITLTDPAPVITGPIASLDTVCIGETLATYSVPMQLGYTYAWSSMGTITSGQGTSAITIDWSALNAGLVSGAVQVVAANQFGCLSAPVAVDVYVLNIVPVITPIGPFCEYDAFVVLQCIPTPVNGVFAGPGVIGSNFYPGNAIGTTNVIYTHTQSGCVFDDTIAVTVYPRPEVLAITPDDEFIQICEGDSVASTYVAVVNAPGITDWTLLSNTTQSPTLTVSWDNVGMYTIQATHTVDGCVSYPTTTTVTVSRCPQLIYYIPNTFTPDGNQYNQTWQPVFTAGFDPAEFRLVVYNRWGQIVWESYNATANWDGTYDGHHVPDGVYTYRVWFGDKETDARYELTGHITLIR